MSSSTSSSSSSPSSSSSENDIESGSESRSSQVALQEPANYGTDLETSVYEGQIRSGYRVPMHPFAIAFFNHYKMVSGQLVPNGSRKLVGLIYLVQTSGYPVTVHDFMRLYLEVCFIKNVAKSVGWYYIHNRIRFIKGGPKSNKGWHSRYFFIQRPSGKWEFPRKWNGYCKDFEKKGYLAPNATTKKLIDHIKRRGVLNIDEPLSDQEMRHAGLIPPAPALPVPPTPVVESQIVLGPKTQGMAIGTLLSRTPSLGRVYSHVYVFVAVIIVNILSDLVPLFFSFLEMAGKGEGAKSDFFGLLQKDSKGKRKEGWGRFFPSSEKGPRSNSSSGSACGRRRSYWQGSNFSSPMDHQERGLGNAKLACFCSALGSRGAAMR
ncbi:hypothetical protein RJ640_001383 [Escallonia rubra]|uniref:Transposase (putative) gypsy type domain-containing protein n=1 Tax=Escallonia rubra TaxID=112253 RepID=A0AA88RPD3_9ASTE|nr:hypothetical protein RJ640_001383 [Escallonia rubra]